MFRVIILLSVTTLALSQTKVRPNVLPHGLPPDFAKESTRAAEEHWFTQKLNHFDILDDRTWLQHYFTSSDFYIPGGPIFLFLGGEGEAYGSYFTASFVGELAQQNGAYGIVLEHRYYGQSRPTENITTENLQWLTTDQALEDTAVFTMYMMESLNLTGPWFVFGGSYSAALASWTRNRYPHLFYAAYASGAPVFAQLDYYEYYEVVNDALLATSPQCLDTVTAAINELRSLVDQGEAEQISEMLNFCETLNINNPDDVSNLYSYVIGFFAFEVQYARNGSLARVCDTLIEGQATPFETLAQMLENYYGVFNQTCLLSVNNDILDYLRDEISFDSEITRRWFYQVHIEIGLYTTTTSPNTPFHNVIPIDFYLLIGPYIYGPEFTRELTEAGIARNNLINGGLTPDVTRVLYVHGSLDPWHRTGILNDLNSETPVVIIEGASHVLDLFATDSQYDSPALTDGRNKIAQIIANWVAEGVAKN